ncbi:MAG: adenosylcobinamide-phosphate synthase CbiB [Rhodospirillaceae bacterium]|nr:adenosylcobinamide-phosphate synthase CbiB [Rhodospirillaceae bacterium]MCY4239651.1 adenosylcobinamide-phosphate synthase CbiB [Rhodospirillaceae bacterium]
MTIAGWFAFTLMLLGAALLLEAVAGYPKALFSRIRHPVVWIGAMITELDRRWNLSTLPEPRRGLNGFIGLMAIVIVPVALATIVQVAVLAVLDSWLAASLLAILASSLFAQHSLHDHVAEVSEGLQTGDLALARERVSMIVGRDPNSLDEAGVARAAIESLAENFSDGVVAPAVWGAAGGLPGMVGYKAINTADSMIGHRDDRYRAFGWSAARLDDLVNLPASRLSVLWIILAALSLPSASSWAALSTVWCDARRHRSPNAGWPEAAVAGALGLRIGGPRRYPGLVVNDAWMGGGRVEATADDIDRALQLYRRACAAQYLTIAISAAAIWLG